MNDKPSIIFMGSKPGSIVALDILIKRKWNILYVVPSVVDSVSWISDINLDEFSYNNKLVNLKQDEIPIDTSGDQSGGLLGLLISTAIQTGLQDYVPVARNVNLMTLRSIPFGKYHNMHDKDQSQAIKLGKIPEN